MENFREYWTVSSIRGALMLVVAGGVAGIGWLASEQMSVPFGPALAIDVLAAFLLLNCGALVLQELVLPSIGNRTALLMEIAGSLAVGGMLYAMVADRIGVGALGWLLSAQAALAAVAEWRIARATYREYRELSCFLSAGVLTVSALLLPLLGNLDVSNLPLALAGYVALNGTALIAVGGRMLFGEYRTGHPATVQSQAWRALMDPALAAHEVACGGCETCAAAAYCADYSTEAQLAKVRLDRAPAIVRSVRALRVLDAAASGSR